VPKPLRRILPRAGALLLAALPLAAACNQLPPETARPKYPETIERAFVSALLAESNDSTAAAGWLDLVDRAVADPRDPRALEAALVSLDTLVNGAPAYGPAFPVALRTRDLFAEVQRRLTKAWERAGGDNKRVSPESAVVRSLLARGVHHLALYAGDETSALVWAKRRGCVEQATVLGPTHPNASLGLLGPSPIAHDKPLPASLSGVPPFAAAVAPKPAHSDRCLLSLPTYTLEGTRAVVADVQVPRAMRVTFLLESASAAVLDVGGKTVLSRSSDVPGVVQRFGAAELPAGKTRLVLRVAQRRAVDLELDVIGDDGEPLAATAPKPGDSAAGVAKGVHAFGTEGAGYQAKWTFEGHGNAVTDKDRSASLALAGAALAATGDVRRAEHLLELRPKVALAELPALPAIKGFPYGKEALKALAERQKQVDAVAPRGDLAAEIVYARALDDAGDMPESKVLAGQKAALVRMRHYLPRAWETRMLAANVAQRSKQGPAGGVIALKELGLRFAEVGQDDYQLHVAEESDPMLLTGLALVASNAAVNDVAEQAYARLAEKATSAPILAVVDRALHARVGVDAIASMCRGALARDGLECALAYEAAGKVDDALGEIERLRRLRGAPRLAKDYEIVLLIKKGNVTKATEVYDGLPADDRRMLDVIGLFAAAGRAEEAKERFSRDSLLARDAPFAYLSITRLFGLGSDSAARFEFEGKKLVEADRKRQNLDDSATDVLLRVEEYTLEESGLLHFTGYDIRRVSGTTDVAMGGGIFAPFIEGRTSASLLRRRIHKKDDGRVIEPNVARQAQQANSDLSQLETGDYVEHLFEGWALPDADGQLVVDTNDMLPERTSVRDARIVFRRPAGVALKLWSHARLGKAQEQTEGKMLVSTWKLTDAKPRSLETNVPRLERNVGISFGTRTWEQIGQAMRDTLSVGLDDKDPYVKRWLTEALVDGSGKAIDPATLAQKELVQKVITATGKKVKRATGGLSDVAAVFGGDHVPSARFTLESGSGSRAWVVFRALRELGVKADVAVAELQPFSASPDFPPHVGRFQRTLVVAHLDGGDQWIDADVNGPPLPLGRVSPELRGRSAMLGTGSIVPVEGASAEGGDEVDVRLVLDESGDATGTLTLLLRGETAQAISELLEDLAGSERREMLRAQVHAWLPRADVEDVTVSSQEGAWEVGLRATVRISGFGQPLGKDGKTWVLPGVDPVHDGGRGKTLGSKLGATGARDNALTVHDAIQYHLRRRVELPKGASLAVTPAAVDVSLGTLSASRKGKYGEVIEEDFRLSLATTTISAQAYAAFAQKLREVDDGFLASTRVKVPTAKVGGTKGGAKEPAPKKKK